MDLKRVAGDNLTVIKRSQSPTKLEQPTSVVKDLLSIGPNTLAQEPAAGLQFRMQAVALTGNTEQPVTTTATSLEQPISLEKADSDFKDISGLLKTDLAPTILEKSFDFSKVHVSESVVTVGGTKWVNPLGDVNPIAMSPIGDLFSINSPEGAKALTERAPAIRAHALAQRQFTSALDDAVWTDVEVDGKKQKLKRADALPRLRELDAFLNSGKLPDNWTAPLDLSSATPLDHLFLGEPPKRLLPDQATSLLEGFKDAGAFEDVARVYESLRAKDSQFGKYDIPREYYIVALNKLGSGRIKDSIRECEAMITDKANLQHLSPQLHFVGQKNTYRSLGLNGEMLSGTGKAYKNIQSQAEKQIDGMVAETNFAQLFSDLSNVKFSDMVLAEPPSGLKGLSSAKNQTAGALGEASASFKFNERLSTLRSRKFEPGSEDDSKNKKDLVDFLESATGLKLDSWTKAKGYDVNTVASLVLGASDSAQLVGQLCGKSISDWSLTQGEVKSIASAPFNQVAGKAVRGKPNADLMALGRQMTGAPLAGAIAEASVSSKMDELSKRVTTGGSVDTELVSLVSKASSRPIGNNLLELSKRSLETSRDYYAAGFGIDFEYYPGINVLYNELALGNYQTAAGLVPLVQYAVSREGGDTSTDYWNLATQIELAAIGNQAQTAHNLLPRLFQNAKAGWELDSTASNLEKLAAQRKDEGMDASVLSFVAEKFRARIDAGFPAPADFDLKAFVADAQKELELKANVSPMAPQTVTPEQAKRQEVSQKIFKKSRNFSDAFNSKFVGGSWAFVSKGGVADTQINRPTIAALRQVNTSLGFDRLTSPNDFPTFSQKMHEYIDTRFGLVLPDGTRPMEDLHSEIHKKRDKFTENRHEFCESRLSGNGRTNLVTEIALGQSDCRHTDATYQACFDLWKRDRQSAELQKCFDSLMTGKTEEYNQAFEKAQAWNQIQVVSMDMAFHAPVQSLTDDKGNFKKYAIMVDGEGKAVRTEGGGLLLDPKTNKPFTLEDHSMPFLLKLDPSGKQVLEMKAVDPFYRGFWNVGNVDVIPEQILDDDKGIYLGNLGTVATDGKPVDLYATPCGYSGLPLGKIPGECGQVSLGGLEVALNDLGSLVSKRNELTHVVNAITDWSRPVASGPTALSSGSPKESSASALSRKMTYAEYAKDH